METVHQYPQTFFSVAEFLSVMEQGYGCKDHDKVGCVVEVDGGYYTNRLVYRLMRDDVLVFDQQMEFFEAEHSCISPNPNGKFYVISYAYESNLPVDFLFNGQAVTAQADFLNFCNNFGSHEAYYPAGLKLNVLQIVVDHSFLADYIDLHRLEQTALHDVVLENSGHVFTMSSVPDMLRSKLDKVVRLVYRPADVPLDKLSMLRAITELLEVFFEMQIPNTETRVDIETLYPKRRQAVSGMADYLAQNVYGPFPGLPNLCKEFSVSSTTLKRQFNQQYGTTPHRLFRRLQMEAAKRILRESEHTVSQIGYLFGFDSPGNFARAFKQCYDTTPSEYRTSMQKPA